MQNRIFSSEDDKIKRTFKGMMRHQRILFSVGYFFAYAVILVLGVALLSLLVHDLSFINAKYLDIFRNLLDLSTGSILIFFLIRLFPMR